MDRPPEDNRPSAGQGLNNWAPSAPYGNANPPAQASPPPGASYTPNPAGADRPAQNFAAPQNPAPPRRASDPPPLQPFRAAAYPPLPGEANGSGTGNRQMPGYPGQGDRQVPGYPGQGAGQTPGYPGQSSPASSGQSDSPPSYSAYSGGYGAQGAQGARTQAPQPGQSAGGMTQPAAYTQSGYSAANAMPSGAYPQSADGPARQVDAFSMQHGAYAGQNAQGQRNRGISGGLNSGMPGGQNPGMPGAQNPGMAGMPNSGMPGGQNPGMPGAQNPGMAGMPNPGMPGAQNPGMAVMPNPGMAQAPYAGGLPGAADDPRSSAYPQSSTYPSSAYAAAYAQQAGGYPQRPAYPSDPQQAPGMGIPRAGQASQALPQNQNPMMGVDPGIPEGTQAMAAQAYAQPYPQAYAQDYTQEGYAQDAQGYAQDPQGYVQDVQGYAQDPQGGDAPYAGASSPWEEGYPDSAYDPAAEGDPQEEYLPRGRVSQVDPRWKSVKLVISVVAALAMIAVVALLATSLSSLFKQVREQGADGLTSWDSLASPDATADPALGGEDAAAVAGEPNRMNLLFMGYDDAADIREARTAFAMLLHVDVDGRKAKLLLFPEDSFLSIDEESSGRLSEIGVQAGGLKNGGWELTSKAISATLGVPVDYHALVGGGTFKSFADLLGGIPFELDAQITVDGQTVPPGARKLTGAQAYAYCADSAVDGDARLQRQKRMLQALYDTAKENALMKKLPDLFGEVRNDMTSDLTGPQVVVLSSVADAMQKADLAIEIVPVERREVQGVAYGILKEEALNAFLMAQTGESLTEAAQAALARAEAAVEDDAARRALEVGNVSAQVDALRQYIGNAAVPADMQNRITGLVAQFDAFVAAGDVQGAQSLESQVLSLISEANMALSQGQMDGGGVVDPGGSVDPGEVVDPGVSVDPGGTNPPVYGDT